MAEVVEYSMFGADEALQLRHSDANQVFKSLASVDLATQSSALVGALRARLHEIGFKRTTLGPLMWRLHRAGVLVAIRSGGHAVDVLHDVSVFNYFISANSAELGVEVLIAPEWRPSMDALREFAKPLPPCPVKFVVLSLACQGLARATADNWG